MENVYQYQQYAEFKERRKELATMLLQSSEIIEELNLQQFSANLQRLSAKVHTDTFKVQIVGTFKNGKSTFINSLLGEEVLPAYALPCTAVVNEVKWGAEKKAIVHFRNPLPEKLPSGIPEKAMMHMKRYHMRRVPPIEISYDEIEQYAVISITHGEEEFEYESPYEKIEVFWPLPILKNGVEIIDSPGLNECATRTRVTMNYISKADAILFVLDATRILSADEMRVIEHTLKDRGFDDPFIIVNKFDAIRAREKDQMRRFVMEKLENYTTNEFHFVSARDALDGKLDNDDELLKSSGVIEFEKSLSNYLTRQKGRAKLLQPTKELKRILNQEALYKAIPLRKAALESSLDDVKKRYEEEEPKLEKLKAKKEQLKSKLLLNIQQILPEFIQLTKRNFMSLSNNAPMWINEYEPRKKVGIIPTKETLDKISKEIFDFVNEKIEDDQVKWRNDVLEPFIDEKTKELFDSIESEMEDLFVELDKIQVNVTGKDYEVTPVPAWQRIAGILGGVALSDIGVAVSGGISGLSKEFIKSLVFEVGAFALLNALGIVNPVTIALTIASLFFYNSSKTQGLAMKKLKDQISGEIVKQLNESTDKTAKSLSDRIGQKYIQFAEHIADSMDLEINTVEKQLKNIIAEMEKGKANVQKKEAELKMCENAVRSLNVCLDDFTEKLMNT